MGVACPLYQFIPCGTSWPQKELMEINCEYFRHQSAINWSPVSMPKRTLLPTYSVKGDLDEFLNSLPGLSEPRRRHLDT